MIKRTLDIAVATLFLVLLVPVFLVVAILVRVKLGPPVMFMQLRPGYKAQPFRMMKFRSLMDVSGADGRLLPDRDRLTPFGHFLRSTSLDELPELWNVVRGEMSLVGPRPLLMEYLPLYSSEQSRRHDVRPGITGWAQINGRNAVTWEKKFALDLWYVDNCSLSLDVKILCLTLVKVVQRHGIAQDGQATADSFRGSSS